MDHSSPSRGESACLWLQMSSNNTVFLSAVSFSLLSDNPSVVFSKKKCLFGLSPLFEFRLSPLYVIKLCEPSRFILLVQDQKRRGERFSGRLPAMFHVVFYQSTLLAPSEHHTLGKSARTCVNWCTRAPLQPAVVIPFFECFPPPYAHT